MGYWKNKEEMTLPDFYDELNNLVKDITDCKITKVEARTRITELKNKYGDDAFPSIHFQVKPKPWNKKYLHKLKEMNITGACSEEFLLHMAEVSEAVAVKRKRFFLGVIIGVIALGILFTMLLMYNGSQSVSALEISADIMEGDNELIVESIDSLYF